MFREKITLTKKMEENQQNVWCTKPLFIAKASAHTYIFHFLEHMNMIKFSNYKTPQIKVWGGSTYFLEFISYTICHPRFFFERSYQK